MEPPQPRSGGEHRRSPKKRWFWLIFIGPPCLRVGGPCGKNRPPGGAGRGRFSISRARMLP